jgi:hypothetical protein
VLVSVERVDDSRTRPRTVTGKVEPVDRAQLYLPFSVGKEDGAYQLAHDPPDRGA